MTNLLQPVPYQDPWDLSFDERFRMLMRGKKRIAYFYEAADNSTFRYRIYNMTQVINHPGDDISASYFYLSDISRLNDIASAADKLVICRARYDGNINKLIYAFKQRGKEVLFDVDDLVFDVDYAQLILRTLNWNTEDPDVWNNWFAYCSRIGSTLKLCDRVITTNDYLANHIRQFSGLSVDVVPNFMNQEQLNISSRIYEAKEGFHFTENQTIRLGYFSGSPSHVNDFALVLPALETVMAQFPQVNLVIAGYIRADALRKRFPSPRVTYYPFCDFVNLQRLIGSVDFNLVPLQYNTFTHCKSQLKYFEAAVVGAQTIASPTYTYANSIRDGENGFLSKAHEWDSVLSKALTTLADFSKMASNAREDALLHFAWYNQRESILRALRVSG